MIKIDRETLYEAIGDYTRSRYYFLNKSTGEIIILFEYMSEASKLELRKKVDVKNLNDLVPIPTISSRDSYKLMEDFIQSVHDTKLSHQLQSAITKEAPFKHFKDIVFKHPEERNRWLDFRQERLTKIAKEWLRKTGVSYSMT